jgi:hypothetical protein
MSESGGPTITCGRCGAVNDAGEFFCQSCGVVLAAYAAARPPTPAVEAEEAAAHIVPDAPEAAPGPVGPRPSTVEPPGAAPTGGTGATAFAGWGADLGTADDWLARAAPGAEGGDASFWDPARFRDDDHPQAVGGRPPADAPAPSGPAAPAPAADLVEPIGAPAVPPLDAVATSVDPPAAPPAAGRDAERTTADPLGPPVAPIVAHAASGATSGPSAPTPPEARRTRWTAPPTTTLFPQGVGGGWLDRTPPRTILLAGALFLLLSCVWLLIAGSTNADGQAAFALFCVAPIGAIALVVGLVMLFVKRPRRRG